ncbi:hypothetical protein POPTR_001G024401v4 [Populus trichocarpa]|uniref:Uncharacterized protein n=1 Tax=Populus trichocarpa TaxID=3694 RepID=A0A3N7F9L7_POPTR|nr:uncharacterized protein LOC7496008 [Populus trichocarpa]RQO84310.1 hypothetical protein POPTR_001G024401v4 [Populus trichocarpa]|eukprot:XP_024459530.1 uncharacterized protein LOC7496008 [Populus trichocarpa]
MAKNFVMLSTEDVFLMTSSAHPARSLFEQCYELQPTFQLLLQGPDHLALNFGEVSTYTQRQVEDTGHPCFVSSVEEVGHIVMDKMNQLSQVEEQSKEAC